MAAPFTVYYSIDLQNLQAEEELHKYEVYLSTTFLNEVYGGGLVEDGSLETIGSQSRSRNTRNGSVLLFLLVFGLLCLFLFVCHGLEI